MKMNNLILELDAGEAKAGADLSPILGQYQVNIVNFCKDFNANSMNFEKGCPVQVIVKINEVGSFSYKIKGPSFSFLLTIIVVEEKGKEEQEKDEKKIKIEKFYDMIRIVSEIRGESEFGLLKQLLSYLDSFKYKIKFI